MLSGAEGSAPPEPTLRTLGLPQPHFHTVILDFSAVSFVDTVSVKILKNVRGWGSRRASNLPRGVPGGGLMAAACPSSRLKRVYCYLQIFRDFREIEVDVFIACCSGEVALQNHQPLLGMPTHSGRSCWPGALLPSMVSPSPGFPQGTGAAGCPRDPA